MVLCTLGSINAQPPIHHPKGGSSAKCHQEQIKAIQNDITSAVTISKHHHRIAYYYSL